jgi:nucleotide-binding universal stress UspA family protein
MKVLVPLDGSAASKRALDHALSLARTEPEILLIRR